MRDFVAIDFETANTRGTSICSVGLVRVEGGKIVDRVHRYVHPTPNYYLARFTAIHGISAADTNDAPRFPSVWSEISSMIKEVPLVAHNASFDSRCLFATLAHYDLAPYGGEFLCTLAASRSVFGRKLANHRLPTVAAACGYTLSNHHDALADAEACAYIAMAIL